MKVRAKKHLGQHFLTDSGVARKIADSLSGKGYDKVLEIGPGKGILTKELLETYGKQLSIIDIDSESIAFLKQHFPQLGTRIIEGDFLHYDLNNLGDGKVAIIGNYPYNISSQILFRVLVFKDKIPETAGMYQHEVAQRIASGPGNKQYGLLSVLLQAWYNITYLFSVESHLFDPPPKVLSGVISLKRNERIDLGVSQKFFTRVVKTAFGQRRKTMRNSLKQLVNESGNDIPAAILAKRPEQLAVEAFIELANLLAPNPDS